MSDTLTDAAILKRGAPAYMAALVDRAAQLLTIRGCTIVDFAWWAAGEDTHYIGRLEVYEDKFQRVVVYDARSGDFVCRSRGGDLHQIDASLWSIDVAADAVDKFEWEQRARSELEGSLPQSLAALRDRLAKDHAKEEGRVVMLRVKAALGAADFTRAALGRPGNRA